MNKVKVTYVYSHLSDLLQAFPDIKYLDLSFTSYINNRLVEELLPHCAKLKVLNLEVCSNISGIVLHSIARYCPDLLELNLTDITVIEEVNVSAVLDGCTKLQTIHIDIFPFNRMSSATKQRFTDRKIKVIKTDMLDGGFDFSGFVGGGDY